MLKFYTIINTNKWHRNGLQKLKKKETINSLTVTTNVISLDMDLRKNCDKANMNMKIVVNL